MQTFECIPQIVTERIYSIFKFDKNFRKLVYKVPKGNEIQHYYYYLQLSLLCSK